MARAYIVEPFIKQHVDRLPETAKQGRGRGVREKPLIIGLRHVPEIQIAGSVIGALTGRERLVTDPDDAQSGWQHETLLRAGDRDVDAPLLHTEINGADGTDAINKQQRRVVEVIKDLANAGNVACHTGRCFIMAGQHGLDAMVFVGFETPPVEIERYALTPIHVEILDVEAEASAHIHPEA